MAVSSPRLSWYRSFYWRISITFVAFVVVFLIIQGIILRRTTPGQVPSEVFRGPVLAAEVAADVAEKLGRGETAELNAHLRSRYPLEPDPEKFGWTVWVATRDKMFSSAPGPLPGIIRLTALSAWGRRRLTSADNVNEIPMAPVIFEGRIVGLAMVLMRHPVPKQPVIGIPRELRLLLSLPSTLALIGAVVVVALVLFYPA